MPCPRRIDPVADVALALLADEQARQKMRLELLELVQPITQPGAADKVAQIIKQMLPRY